MYLRLMAYDADADTGSCLISRRFGKIFEVVPAEHKLVELGYRILKTPYTLNAHLYLVSSFHRANP